MSARRAGLSPSVGEVRRATDDVGDGRARRTRTNTKGLSPPEDVGWSGQMLLSRAKISWKSGGAAGSVADGVSRAAVSVMSPAAVLSLVKGRGSQRARGTVSGRLASPVRTRLETTRSVRPCPIGRDPMIIGGRAVARRSDAPGASMRWIISIGCPSRRSRLRDSARGSGAEPTEAIGSTISAIPLLCQTGMVSCSSLALACDQELVAHKTVDAIRQCEGINRERRLGRYLFHRPRCLPDRSPALWMTGRSWQDRGERSKILDRAGERRSHGRPAGSGLLDHTRLALNRDPRDGMEVLDVHGHCSSLMRPISHRAPRGPVGLRGDLAIERGRARAAVP